MESEPLFRLCRFVSSLDPFQLPLNVVHHAEMVLLDTLGVIMAGSRTPAVERMARGFPASPSGVTCPGRSQRLDPLHAVLINGMAGSSLEFEEGNSPAMGHPAIQMVPAILSECEAQGLSGAIMLKALIGGYEVACRVSRASSIRRGLHPTGTWGVVGSAVAVGLLRHRGAEDLCRIANIAASFSFSPYVKNSFAGRNLSCTFAGLVNYLGLLSNQFHDSGIEPDPENFQMTFSRFVSEKFDPDVLAEGLGEAFAICGNYFKPYPACRFTHPAIEALGVILGHHRIEPGDVKSVEVTSFKAAVHTGGFAPENLEAMRFSVPYLLAALIARGKIDLPTLSEKLLHDPEIAGLAGRVKLIFSPEYEKMRPHRNAARVLVEMKDGRSFSHEILHCLGDPGNPLLKERIVGKFKALTEPVIGAANSERFVQIVERIENEADVRPSIALLRG